MANSKTTGAKISSLAGKTLASASTSKIQRSLAEIALVQTNSTKSTSKKTYP